MKYLVAIYQEENEKGSAELKDAFTNEETIITMPADRFEKFFRKFRHLIGQRVEVANGWIFSQSQEPQN